MSMVNMHPNCFESIKRCKQLLSSQQHVCAKLNNFPVIISGTLVA